MTSENRFIIPEKEHYIYTIREISTYDQIKLDIINEYNLAILIEVDEKVIELKIKSSIFRLTIIFASFVQILIIITLVFIVSKLRIGNTN